MFSSDFEVVPSFATAYPSSKGPCSLSHALKEKDEILLFATRSRNLLKDANHGRMIFGSWKFE